MDEISISRLKAECLKLLAKVHSSKDPLLVTKNGDPLVVIYPVSKQKRRPAAGSLKNTAQILGDLINHDKSADWKALK
ncbi:MAG: type II toxin-antitoxin system Phd/YefM family antitoxin [SAR324 cluster bacterium]|uniref:Antitoxin n=1 Tax=SAR324 cluster bacterium TaxID=2024889 RepID=A0A7X9II90_9DELT|nr:type II toxin-antitoxin system Phd/YefM family antitoxin [SAR324 cluster bacterium]